MALHLLQVTAMLKTICRLCWLSVALLAAVPALSAAQSDEGGPVRVDISGAIGVMAPTDWSDLVLLGSLSPATGVLEQVLAREVRVASATGVDGAVTYWRGRYGFRVQAGLAQTSLKIGGAGEPAQTSAINIDMDTWSYDVRGVIGLLDYAPRRWVSPYTFLGFGGITYDLDQAVAPSLITFVERSGTGVPGTIIVDDDQRQILLAADALETETVFAVSFGIGTDLRVPVGAGGIGLRLEISDHIAPSPVGLQIGELRRSGPLAGNTGVNFGSVNHFRATAGFVVQFGR